MTHLFINDMDKNKNAAKLGFVSSDGFFQHISRLNANTLEYAGKSVNELHALLWEKVGLEEYETCAIIRDEINKREQDEH